MPCDSDIFPICAIAILHRTRLDVTRISPHLCIGGGTLETMHVTLLSAWLRDSRLVTAAVHPGCRRGGSSLDEGLT